MASSSQVEMLATISFHAVGSKLQSVCFQSWLPPIPISILAHKFEDRAWPNWIVTNFQEEEVVAGVWMRYRESMADPYPIHTSVAILRGKRLWLQSSSLSLCYGSKAFEVNRVWSTLSKQVWMLWIESFLIEEWPIHTFNPIFKVSIDGMDRKRFN